MTAPVPFAADLIVIAKEPVPGRVKTRLTPPFTPHQAAALAEASLKDTLESVAAAPAVRRVLALAGSPGPWLPDGFDVIPQRGEGLDERLANAFDDAYQGRPLVLVGMDTPQLTWSLLADAAAALATHDATFGRASDGGFWLLGLRTPDASLLRGVPMSRPDTGHFQLCRLAEAALTVAHLPELTDVDTHADAAQVAAHAPTTRFAAIYRTLTTPFRTDQLTPATPPHNTAIPPHLQPTTTPPKQDPPHPQQHPAHPQQPPAPPDQVPARSDRGTARPEQGAARPEQGAARPGQGAARSEQGAPRLENGAARSGRGTARPEQRAARSEQDAPGLEHGATRSEQRPARPEQGAARSGRGAPRLEHGAARSDRGAARSEQDVSCLEHGVARSEQGPARSKQGATRPERNSGGSRELDGADAEVLLDLEGVAFRDR
ncbi:TIGR04282 family arsenosugar biosynthesis glycosyltransferase [Spirillospora sp. NPDC052269]